MSRNDSGVCRVLRATGGSLDSLASEPVGCIEDPGLDVLLLCLLKFDRDLSTYTLLVQDTLWLCVTV